MQEIKKRRIVIASVLKPANDPRMFDKIGQSLAPQFQVHCIGRGAPANELLPNPQLHPLPTFQRLSPFRLIAPLLVLKKIVALKPSILIICTHELLLIALVAKALIRCKVIYDVQENYYRNILYGNSFFVLIRPLLAFYVRSKEWISTAFIDHYFLAEKSYELEMTFPQAKKTVLENKVKDVALPLRNTMGKAGKNVHLLFSGTLAETTGVFIAIDLAKKLHTMDQRIRLTIIGQSAVQTTISQIKKEIYGCSFIELVGGSIFVSHQEILTAIRTVDFGIIAYPPNPSTVNTVPTKLYEYLGYQLPILLIDNPTWVNICKPFNAAIPFNPDTLSPAEILQTMNKQKFFTTLPQDVFWSSEEKKLLQTIETILPSPNLSTHPHPHPNS